MATNTAAATPRGRGSPSPPPPSEDSYWEYDFNIDTALRRQINEYCQNKLHEYSKLDYIDESMWEIFKGDFGNFEKQHFSHITTTNSVGLRDFLLRSGVFLQKNDSRYTIGNALFSSAQEDQYHR